MRIFRSDILKTRFCFNVFAVYLVKMLNQRTNEEMSNYLCASDILIPCRKQINCIEGLTRSEADSSSVYPMERKFAWRAANSFFKFPSNFFHPFKIFPFICREKFLSSPFTNGATICISKGWTRGSLSSEKSSWSKSFAIAVLAIIQLIETLRT